MPDEPTVCSDLKWILERYPERATIARRLFCEDQDFRGACEDHRLAREGLAKFEKLAGITPRSEVGEYRAIVRELESELLAMLDAKDGAGGAPVAKHTNS